MTLIAGFEFNESPILIGDLVLSAGNRRTALRRKVVRVSDRFAISWSGNSRTADTFFRRMEKKFQNRTYTFKNVRKFLLSFTENEFGSFDLFGIAIIGSIVEKKRSKTFFWRIDYPCEVFTGEFHIWGEGVKATELPIEQLSIQNYMKEATDNGTLPIMAALAYVAVLMRREVVNFNDLDNTKFGHCYEVIFFDGEKFRFLSDISFLTIELSLGSGREYLPDIASPMMSIV
jgi:hypothetical protein